MNASIEDGPAIVATRRGARSVRGIFDPHLGPAFAALALAPPMPAFEEPGALCQSFSAWWARVAGRRPSARPWQ